MVLTSYIIYMLADISIIKKFYFARFIPSFICTLLQGFQTIPLNHFTQSIKFPANLKVASEKQTNFRSFLKFSTILHKNTLNYFNKYLLWKTPIQTF